MFHAASQALVLAGTLVPRSLKFDVQCILMPRVLGNTLLCRLCAAVVETMSFSESDFESDFE